ncbi:MAG: DUF5682 family protein, partial [Planctomycetia bacterium]|nr:DUF5682 family protein [Planctomycetia bacterium]
KPSDEQAEKSSHSLFEKNAQTAHSFEALREAAMRQALRVALQEKHERIAVVCGAWHVPVLNLENQNKRYSDLIPSKKEDDALLSGLPKIKVMATWCPWTCSRLAYRSGYGAGIESPGWYEHLWKIQKNATAHWLTKAARLLRKSGIDISAANVIEAVRLAETLAVLRDRPAPNLHEMNDAILSVLCQGKTRPLELIRDQLEIGVQLGTVPPGTKATPLQCDIEKEQKRLRFKLTEEMIELDLDLRKENDRDKSRLLHRFLLLNIPWGTPLEQTSRSSGSFHERWQLQWQVEFVVRIIEAGVWGSTLETACVGAVDHELQTAESLAKISRLLERVLPAELPQELLDRVFLRLQNDAAVSSDIGGLMTALIPLVQIIRYGDVRQTNPQRVEAVFNALFARVVVGLLPACSSLDDEAAETRVVEIDQLQTSLQTLNRDEVTKEWLQVLVSLVNSDSIHGLLCGRCCRILYEQGILTSEELAVKLGFFVSPATEPSQVAVWLQGFLKGNGQTLIHLDSIWSILNTWLCSLDGTVFIELLPLMRRSFSEFTPPELRMMGERVKGLSVSNESAREKTTDSPQLESLKLDEKRIAKLLPTLNAILGWSDSSIRDNRE